jgi:hypothetical protein
VRHKNERDMYVEWLNLVRKRCKPKKKEAFA